jgi:hypothetical protein
MAAEVREAEGAVQSGYEAGARGLIKKAPQLRRGLIESDARVQRKSKAKGFLPGCALRPL